MYSHVLTEDIHSVSTRRLPVQAHVAATEFKEFSQHKHLIQTIVKIMHKRMRFKLLRLNRC